MKQARETGKPLPRVRGGFLTGCGCVFSKLAVLHDGTLVPCNMLPGLGMGNIREDSVRDIWKTHPTLQALRERRKIPMRDVPGCTDCDWADLCTGGCPALPHASFGRLDRANRMDCFRSFLEEAGHVPAG
jgi:radical SAM protein with 4Fe4S-binding SPASM domain